MEIVSRRMVEISLNGQGDEEQANFWTYNANNELTNSITYNPDQDNPSNTFTKATSYDPNGNETEIVSYTEHQQQEDGDGNDSDQNFTYDVARRDGEIRRFE